MQRAFGYIFVSYETCLRDKKIKIKIKNGYLPYKVFSRQLKEQEKLFGIFSTDG